MNRFLSKMKLSLSQRKDTEHQQAGIRILLTAIFLVTFFSLDQQIIFFLTIAYLFISSGIFISILVSPEPSDIRKYIGIVGDAVMTSSVLYIAEEASILSLFVYLWVIIGNGFRYGVKYLKVSTITSIIGASLALGLGGFWSQYIWVSFVFLLCLAVLPLYMVSLLKQLQNATRKAEQASKAKSEFLANMSHELRTPLNGIIAVSELLFQRDLGEKEREYANVIHSSGKTLLMLVDDVLDFSKIEAGKITIELSPFHLRDAIENTLLTFETQAKSKGILLQLDIANGLPELVVSDESNLRKILMNFLSNAVKFTHHGSVSLRISLVQNDEATAQVQFQIQDTGIGMSEEALAVYFDGFTQADSSITRQYGGTDLGTTIAKSLILAMGGSIEVQSKVAHGTTVTFTLPLQVTNQQFPSLNTMEKTTDEQHPLMHLNIFVAEDNRVNQMVIEEILGLAGHDVTLKHDGESALQCLESSLESSNPFDLAILDINMPLRSGIEVVEAFRAKEKGTHLPIIMISADARSTSISQCLAAGANAYLTKPIEMNKLNAIMVQVLAGQPITQAKAETIESGQNLIDEHILSELQHLTPSTSFVESVIAEYLSHSAELLSQMKKAMHDNNTDAFYTAAHTLKGSSDAIGARKISDICVKAERTQLNKEIMQGLLTDISTIYTPTCFALSEFTAQLSAQSL